MHDFKGIVHSLVTVAKGSPIDKHKYSMTTDSTALPEMLSARLRDNLPGNPPGRKCCWWEAGTPARHGTALKGGPAKSN